MFAYSFLAMTSYNIIQPITRSKFITSLGAENLPYVQFGAGLLIGVIMQGYSRATALLPRRWVIPLSQAADRRRPRAVLGAVSDRPGVGVGRLLPPRV